MRFLLSKRLYTYKLSLAWMEFLNINKYNVTYAIQPGHQHITIIVIANISNFALA